MSLADELYAKGLPIIEERRARLRRVDDVTTEMLVEEHAAALRKLEASHQADIDRYIVLLRDAAAEMKRLQAIVAVDRRERTLTAAIKAAEKWAH